jgi:hypothetical protein
MLTTTQLKDYAQLSQASYAHLTTYTSGQVLPKLLEAPNKASRFTDTQARQLLSKYTVVHQSAESGWLDGDFNGFNATVFRDIANPNHVVLSFRGTEFDNDPTRDLFITDLQIGTAGYAKPQALALYRYIRSLQTNANATVEYSEAEMQRMYLLQQGPDLLPFPLNVFLSPLSLITDLAAYALFKASLQNDKGVDADAGQGSGPVLAPGQTVDVTGHSLGGHLAMLAQRLFPDLVTGTAVTYNAVAFNAPPMAGTSIETRSNWILSQFGASGFSNNVSRVESVGDGVSELARTYPGTTLTVGMETYPGLLAAFSNNHSVANIADGLALVEFMGKLDPRYMADPRLAKELFKAGSNEPVSSYEKLLDGLRTILGGPVSTPTPNDNGENPGTSREPFYKNLQSLADLFAEPNGALRAFAGRFTLSLPSTSLVTTAKTDFVAFLNLNALSPVSITTTDEAAISALKAANPTLATAWTADYNARLRGDTTKVFDYSDNWYADRAAMLAAVVRANQQDVADSEGLIVPGATGMRYLDVATNREVNIGLVNDVVEKRQTLFGSDGNDGADKLTGKRLADRIYGGAGDDQINGKFGWKSTVNALG